MDDGSGQRKKVRSNRSSYKKAPLLFWAKEEIVTIRAFVVVLEMGGFRTDEWY